VTAPTSHHPAWLTRARDRFDALARGLTSVEQLRARDGRADALELREWAESAGDNLVRVVADDERFANARFSHRLADTYESRATGGADRTLAFLKGDATAEPVATTWAVITPMLTWALTEGRALLEAVSERLQAAAIAPGAEDAARVAAAVLPADEPTPRVTAAGRPALPIEPEVTLSLFPDL
jgi:hypothetical protein